MADTDITPDLGDGPAARLYRALTSEEAARVCRDVPESACRRQPTNFFKHVASLAATKTGDGLADPKLVLAWLTAQIGAPAAAIGWLVPVREAGALLPQLAIAAWIHRRPRRKVVWALGSAAQGLCVLGMAAVGALLDGAVAGWSIVALLALFAVSRSVCSVSYRDVLGRTVSKTTRGTATATAKTVAAVAVLVFGALLATGILQDTRSVLTAALVLAGSLWTVAAGIFATLAEEPRGAGSDDEDGADLLQSLRDDLGMLGRDGQLQRFIAVRSLLVATAVAPPYLLAVSGDASTETTTTADAIGEAPTLFTLGPFVLASSLAAVSSSYVWGRLADRSSRRVLILAACIGAAALGTAGTVAVAAPSLLAGPLVLPAILFVLMIGYAGVRLGRSTHIVDMADDDSRAAHTALSNTVVGVVLLATGAFGFVAQGFGSGAVLLVFAAMCAGAAWLGTGLQEVQAPD